MGLILPIVAVLVGIAALLVSILGKRRPAAVVLSITSIALAVLFALALSLLGVDGAVFSAWTLVATIIPLALAVVAFVIPRREATGVGPVTSATGPTNGLAVASLIVVFFSSLIGLILGHVALSQINRTGENGKGLAIAAVAIGWTFTALAIVGGIVSAILYGGLVNR